MDRYEAGADVDGDGKSDSRMRAESIPVPVFYDVRFDFVIRAGAPQVKSSAGLDMDDRQGREDLRRWREGQPRNFY
jgi:hypothetical protein